MRTLPAGDGPWCPHHCTPSIRGGRDTPEWREGCLTLVLRRDTDAKRSPKPSVGHRLRRDVDQAATADATAPAPLPLRPPCRVNRGSVPRTTRPTSSGESRTRTGPRPPPATPPTPPARSVAWTERAPTPPIRLMQCPQREHQSRQRLGRRFCHQPRQPLSIEQPRPPHGLSPGLQTCCLRSAVPSQWPRSQLTRHQITTQDHADAPQHRSGPAFPPIGVVLSESGSGTRARLEVRQLV